MNYNLQLDDAIDAIEELLNSSKASYVIDTIKKLKNSNNQENISLD